ncbi:MAG: dihydropyrimidinase [Synergistaceae bacterium]|jgi:dihydropyrimidinase|nr:dihydropyrimidinase [Synergistaceae bacterium]
MALVLAGGVVANSDGVYRADVRIDGETIAGIGTCVVGKGDEVLDVSGKYLLPGGIDAHTHFDLPLSNGVRTADSFFTGTRAAIAGGTTCVIDYATQFKSESLREGLGNWHRLADGKCFCDYAFHMAITDWNESVSDELPEMISSGVTSFKMYMAYKGSLQVDDGVIYWALKRVMEVGGLLCVHCENGDVISALTEELSRRGCVGPEFHPVSRPPVTETEAVSRLTSIASLVGAPVYVVHVSAYSSMEKIIEAKARGARLFAETCPQYLYLDDSLYGGGWEAAKYVCSPPLRGSENHEGLWASLRSGFTDVVATDHCSFNFEGQKDGGHKDGMRGDFAKIPNGMPGVESRVLLMYKGVSEGRLSLPAMVRVISSNPAAIFGIYPRKGILIPGADADIVVLNPSGKTVISARTQFQNVDYTPFEGVEVPASIDAVYLRGVEVFRGGKFLEDAPAGRYVPRRASGLSVTDGGGVAGTRL